MGTHCVPTCTRLHCMQTLKIRLCEPKLLAPGPLSTRPDNNLESSICMTRRPISDEIRGICALRNLFWRSLTSGGFGRPTGSDTLANPLPLHASLIRSRLTHSLHGRCRQQGFQETGAVRILPALPRHPSLVSESRESCGGRSVLYTSALRPTGHPLQ